MWRGLGKGKKRGNDVIFKLYICLKKKKKKELQPSVVASRGRKICEFKFKDSLVYKVSSRTAKVYREPTSKNNSSK